MTKNKSKNDKALSLRMKPDRINTGIKFASSVLGIDKYANRFATESNRLMEEGPSLPKIPTFHSKKDKNDNNGKKLKNKVEPASIPYAPGTSIDKDYLSVSVLEIVAIEKDFKRFTKLKKIGCEIKIAAQVQQIDLFADDKYLVGRQTPNFVAAKNDSTIFLEVFREPTIMEETISPLKGVSIKKVTISKGNVFIDDAKDENGRNIYHKEVKVATTTFHLKSHGGYSDMEMTLQLEKTY